jgi:hypothetical protein
VVIVNTDDNLRGFLSGLDFAILSPVPLPPVGSPVTSVGYSDGSMWTNGTNESLLPVDRGNLHFTSEVGEGQSGGAVYNDAWELIGMALRSGAGTVYARPIDAVIKSLKNWDIPILLAARSLTARVKGADELARENRRRANQAIAQALSNDLNFGEEGSVLSPRTRDALWKLTLSATEVKRSYLSLLLTDSTEMLRAAQSYARVSRAIGINESEYEETGSLVRAASELMRTKYDSIKYNEDDGLESTIQFLFPKLDDEQRSLFFNEYIKFIDGTNGDMNYGLSKVFLAIAPNLTAQQTRE